MKTEMYNKYIMEGFKRRNEMLPSEWHKKPAAKKDYTAQTRRLPEKDMIFGIRAIMEAIDAGREIDKILLRRDMGSDLARQLYAKLQGTTVPVQRVPQEKLNRFTDKNHQGAIAFIAPITFQRIEDIVPALYEAGRVPFVVVLDGVTDVRNFGAIARTCECAGVDALVIPARGGAAVNADAVKTSAGALHSIPVCRTENLANSLQFLADSGLKIVAATEKAEQTYTQCDLTGPLALVMGAEDTGIAPENLRLCHAQVQIPMFGTIASLNVSVSAGILMYEVIRQRS